MGAGARPAAAALQRRVPRGAAARAGVRHRGGDGRLVRHRQRGQQAGSGAGGGCGSARAVAVVTARCGFAAIVGAPNAGKSTLLNRLTGAKLSIVTPKAQTTRFRVLGILMRGDSQILLVDTPGIFRPRRRLDRAMVAAAWSGAADADLVLLLVDARTGATDGVRTIAESLGGAGRRVWLVFNKTDLVSPPALLPLTATLSALAAFEQIFMVSAATGDGLDRLLDALAAAMPEGPFLYAPDELTDLPDRLLAAELVREQVFLQTHEEVPYAATVETESWQERRDGSVRIDATIYVARPGHKAIVIGEGGARVREIGARARAALAALLERPVHLFLHV
ncbi:MAG: GTPase Era, partial [Acetobacteraceae bacterium]|nr:GTPase Era [Acetobacteraceae bacterium]